MEGIGDLNAVEPVDSHSNDGSSAENFQASLEGEGAQGAAQAEMEPVDPSGIDKAEEIRLEEGDGDSDEVSLSIDQLIEAIDEEIEDGFEIAEGPERATVPEPAVREEQFVSFSLAGTEYAVPIQNVTEITYLPEVTPLPNVPEWVLGVANLRGDLISMVDLRAFFGMDRAILTGSNRMLVGKTTHDDLTVGLIIDGAHGIRYLAVDDIDKPTADIESQIAPYLYGAYEQDERLLVLLDLDQVLNSPELRQFG